MRQYVAGVLVLGLLAGCTADWDSSRTSAKGLALRAARPEAASLQDQRSDPAARRIGVRNARDFASLADRGELLAYAMPRDRRLTQKSGTAYQVRLSEAHAFNAAHEGGRIVVPLPDGGSAALTYERHVEHPDGNWSWIGRDENGADAVLTFGEKAAFGTIPQTDGESWRLTTAAGRSWLTKNDRNRIAAMGSGKRASTDALVPPDAAGDASQTESPGAHSNITMVATGEALATVTVDVLVGYTEGFAAERGGQSQAVTKINNLVDITNQAYANSGVNATVRLVGAQQVAYPDATDNGKALEEVSGQTENGSTTPHPAFAALRAARETLSADLVVLLRDFQSPENNGCGIAWLIGSNQSGIEQADALYGYSVVSDGSDNGFFCRDESFAHEIGHNMGQAHNVDDSDGKSGLHSYSYGYRETFSTGFYTIMSYALTGANQTGIRYFANPNITFNGRPTGVANASDNVRSMNQSIPVVATFRAAPARARNDIDGNGKSDLVWWNQSLGMMAYWSMNGSQLVSGYNQGFGTALTPSTTGRSTSSGRTDILMRRASDRMLFSFQSQSSGFVQYSVGQYGDGWTVVGQGDIDGDGKDDIFLRHPQQGHFAYWLMDGPVYKGGQTYTPPTYYLIAAIADFNGDGRVDIVWNSPGDRTMSMWLSVGSGFTVSQIGQYGADWRLIGATDVTGDRKADLLWRSTNNQYMAYWRMDGAVYLGAYAQGTPTNYEFSAMGDYNGDGVGDLVWTRPSDRNLYMWIGNGTGFNESLIGQYGADWALQP